MSERHPCERCGKYEILLPICGPCQREEQLGGRNVRDDVVHGTTWGYKKGCRCLPCTTEHAAKYHLPALHGSGNFHTAKPLEYTRLAYGDERADFLSTLVAK